MENMALTQNLSVTISLEVMDKKRLAKCLKLKDVSDEELEAVFEARFDEAVEEFRHRMMGEAGYDEDSSIFAKVEVSYL